MRRSRLATYVVGFTLLAALAACDSQVTLSPPSPGALVPDEGQNLATVHPAHIGATNPGFGTGSCPSEGWGWHFVMQGSPSENYFVELAATFSRDGEQVTLIAEEFDPNPQHGYIYTDGPGWRLDASEAIVVGGSTRYNLSHVCTGPESGTTAPILPTSTVQPTTTLQVTTTTIQETTTTTIEPTTTLSLGGLTTTTQGEVTTTTGGDGATTTDAAESVTTTIPSTTTTVLGVTTTADAGVTTTGDPETTTTGDGETGAAAETTAPGGGEGDPSTTGDVAGSETLPNTGSGDTSTAGLAGLLSAAGLVLLVIARRSVTRPRR